MGRNDNFYKMTDRVKKSLADLDLKIRKNKSYLKIKLKTASEDQITFYEFFLGSGNLESFLERYQALFSSSVPREEDYEYMKYYVNHLRYFSSIDPIADFRYDR